jgi:two-component system, LytTR family, response regulator
VELEVADHGRGFGGSPAAGPVHADGGPHLIRDSLTELEPRLDPAHFVRVHRGEIIQARAVVRLDALAHGDAVAELDDGSSVVISRTHRDSFLVRWRGR